MVAKRKISPKGETQNTAQTTETKGEVKANHNLILLAVRTDLEIAEQKKEMEPFVKIVTAERQGITTKMVEVAKTFSDIELFETWALGEEDFIKSDSAGANKVDRIPRSWVQSKSNILTAWRKWNIRPDMVENAFDLNHKLQEARKADRDVKKKLDLANKDASAAIKEAVKSAETMDTQLAGRVGAIVQSYPKLSDEDKDTCIKLLDVVISAAAKGELSVVHDYLHKAVSENIAEALGVLDADAMDGQQAEQVAH